MIDLIFKIHDLKFYIPNPQLLTPRMYVRQDPIVFAVGDDAAAIGALSRRGDFSRGATVGAVGDGVAFFAGIGREASLAVEDHLVAHVPVAVGVAFEHAFGLVVDDIVAHDGVNPYSEHFLVAVLHEAAQRAMPDADFLHDIGFAKADVFVELLFVLVKQGLALEGTDDFPILGGPSFLYLHEHFARETDELVGREVGVDCTNFFGYNIGVVHDDVGIGLLLNLLVDIGGVCGLALRLFLGHHPDDDEDDEQDEPHRGVVDEQSDKVGDDFAYSFHVAKADATVTAARGIPVDIAHVGGGVVDELETKQSH